MVYPLGLRRELADPVRAKGLAPKI
jgi:hypothetical protein